MRQTLTISLPSAVRKDLDAQARRRGAGRSEIVREALVRYLAVTRFDDLRERTLPKARARGIVTDEDVFDRIS